MSSHRRAPLAALLLVLPIAVLTPHEQAAAAGPTCDGRPATIVGDGRYGGQVVGTAGPDVIVTRGAHFVDAKGGDDVVCITGTVSEQRHVKVFDGPGDDLVRNDATYRTQPGRQDSDVLDVYLFAGDDTYVGGAAPEFVAAYTGVDDIDTGGGVDSVYVGTAASGRPDLAGPFSGRIDLGTDGGSINLGVQVQPETVLVGDGTAGLGLDRDFPARDWTLDAGAGTASFAGVPRFTFTGFVGLGWGGQHVVSYTGTGGTDRLVAGRLDSAAFGAGDDYLSAVGFGDADLGEGDDQAEINGLDTGFTGLVRGGPGRDSLSVYAADEADLDVPAGRVTVNGGPVHFTDVDAYALEASELTVTGGPDTDELVLSGCRTTASTGAGADLVTVYEIDPETDWCPRPRLVLDAGPGDDRVRSLVPAAASSIDAATGADRVTANGTVNGGPGDDHLYGRAAADRFTGGPGDDLLSGAGGRDVLRGGTGTDEARGGGGSDRCQAETQRRCEV